MESNDNCWIICHQDDKQFRAKTYAACRIIMNTEDLQGSSYRLPIADFQHAYEVKFNETLTSHSIQSMRHAIEVILFSKNVLLIKLFYGLRFPPIKMASKSLD